MLVSWIKEKFHGIDTYKSTIDTQVALMEVANKFLPINQESPSRIRYHLILLIAKTESDSIFPTIKTLFTSIPHSDTAIRKHFDALLDEGLITLQDDASDRRVRHVLPTPRLIAYIESWLRACNKVLDNSTTVDP